MQIKILRFIFLFILALVISLFCCDKAPWNQKKFVVGAWIPYWKKISGCEVVDHRMIFFNELSPFAFEVETDGSLKDTLKIEEEPWSGLLQKAKNQNVLILPTILWTDSQAIHNILSDNERRKDHTDQILNLLESKKFDGIDIDYEGKNIADKEIFSTFITELSSILKSKGYRLSCTVEARTTDDPSAGWQGTQAMAWANDFSILNQYCDEVRMMAYDQPFQTKGAKGWRDHGERLYAPNADISWVREVIRYAVQKINPEKIILGIPTYGWEFSISGAPKNWTYRRSKSISYPQALEFTQSYSIIPKRDQDTELHFLYEKNDQKYLVWFPDSESIRQEIRLAKKYRLGGIVFFKMDGLEDKKMWEMLVKELGPQRVR